VPILLSSCQLETTLLTRYEQIIMPRALLRSVFMLNDKCTEGSGSVIWAERKETEEKKTATTLEE